MLRILRLAAIFFVCAVAVDARPDAVKVRVRVILVDQELNQKPVPFLVVSMQKLSFLQGNIRLRRQRQWSWAAGGFPGACR